MQRDVVRREDLERELRAIEALAPGQIEGVFGPASLTWRVNREAAIFLGAGRALLLQLAHPYVAAGIADHSRTLADPIGRFHRTFNITFTLVFGTLDQALRAARHLHQRHSAIQGVLPTTVGPFVAGTAYRANDVAALRWVYATLVETAQRKLPQPLRAGCAKTGRWPRSQPAPAHGECLLIHNLSARLSHLRDRRRVEPCRLHAERRARCRRHLSSTRSCPGARSCVEWCPTMGASCCLG